MFYEFIFELKYKMGFSNEKYPYKILKKKHLAIIFSFLIYNCS